MAIWLRHLPKQHAFYVDDTSPVLFVAGLGFGKTMVCADKILTSIARYPKASHFIFSNTYSQLASGTLKTVFERLDDTWIPGDSRFEYIDRVRFDKTIVFPKLDAVINVRSCDQPIAWKSLEICVAFIDEAQAWAKNEYDMVIGRLRGSATQRRLYPDMKLQVFLSCNAPHSHAHWIYEQTHEPSPLTGEPPMKMHRATTFENPFLPKKYVDVLQESYDVDIARAELWGEFVDLGRGKVYRRFSREKHVLDDAEAQRRGLPPLRYDPSLPLCWAHDFNLSPLCSTLFQWRRVNVKGYQKVVMYVLDCIRIMDALISDAPKELLSREEAAKVARRNGVILYGDAAGSQKSRQTGDTDWAALKQEMDRLGLYGSSRVPASNPLHVDSAADTNRQLEDSLGNLGVVIAKNVNTAYLMLDLEKMSYKDGSVQFDIPKAKPGEVLPKSQQMSHLADSFRYGISFENAIQEQFRFNMSSSR